MATIPDQKRNESSICFMGAISIGLLQQLSLGVVPNDAFECPMQSDHIITAVELGTRTKKSIHVTAVMKKFRWLLVKTALRSQSYEVLSLAYNCMEGSLLHSTYRNRTTAPHQEIAPCPFNQVRIVHHDQLSFDESLWPVIG